MFCAEHNPQNWSQLPDYYSVLSVVQIIAVLFLYRMRCRRTTGTTGKAALKSESFDVGGVGGGGAGTSGGKTSEAQVTKTGGGRSINVEREVSYYYYGELFLVLKF